MYFSGLQFMLLLRSFASCAIIRTLTNKFRNLDSKGVFRLCRHMVLRSAPRAIRLRLQL